MAETDTLAGLFHRLIRSATEAQRVPMSEQTECYLVQMLTAFVRPAAPDLLDPPLGVDYLTALNLPAAQRFARLRRVADTALFLTGLFLEHLENTLVGGEYYATLGRSAYARLSADEPHAGLAEAFADLSQRFGAFVRILGEIGDTQLFNTERDTLRLYRRWLLTRGPREAELLLRRGVIPFAPPGSSTRH
ncbi:MAG TPA: hypothetical protein VNO26_06700 [Candidatus Limnocylindria bacterium]|nr:hypothetical protein [Candidatus Limnocylindria bacterium]